MQKFHLDQLDCANCAARIEKAVQEIPSVRFASVDFASTTLFLDSDDIDRVKQAIQRIEPEIRLEEKSSQEINIRDHSQWRSILAAGILFSLGLILKSGH